MDTAGQDRHQTATYSAMRARTVTLGEVEDALWALAERRDLHDYSDGRDEHICHCVLCQEIVPAVLQLGGGTGMKVRAGARAPPAGARSEPTSTSE